MKPKPFKFRHVNRIAGAFLFMTVVVLIVLAVLAGKSQHWFDKVTRYQVEMPVGFRGDEQEGGTLGIRPGSDVRVIGNQVGHVERVELCSGDTLTPIHSFDGVDPGEIRIVALLSVKGEFSNFIGPDSVAVVKFDLGGLGSAYFDISRGTKRFSSGDAEAHEPKQLAIGVEKDAKEEVFEIVQRLEDEIIPAIRRYEQTATAAAGFFEKLNDDNETLYRALATFEKGVDDFARVMEEAASGEGALGDMIRSDSEMRREFNEFAVSLNRGTQSLEKSVNNFGEGIDELREIGFTSFNEAAADFPGTMNNTNSAIDQIEVGARQFQETVREFEILVEALQKHWLVRKHIVDPIEDRKPVSANRQDRGPSKEEKEGPLKKLFKKDD